MKAFDEVKVKVRATAVEILKDCYADGLVCKYSDGTIEIGHPDYAEAIWFAWTKENKVSDENIFDDLKLYTAEYTKWLDKEVAKIEDTKKEEVI